MLATLLLAATTGGSAARAADGAPGPDASPANAATPVDAKPPEAHASMLDAHNELRAKHCAPPLAWSESLAKAAQQWADSLAARGCSLEHSASEYGENLAGETLGRGDPADVVRRWYVEAAEYDFRKPGFSTTTGHFTQLVWVGTQRLGCGRAQCAHKEVWVCNYDPAGNVRGQFPQNVQPTTCAR